VPPSPTRTSLKVGYPTAWVLGRACGEQKIKIHQSIGTNKAEPRTTEKNRLEIRNQKEIDETHAPLGRSKPPERVAGSKSRSAVWRRRSGRGSGSGGFRAVFERGRRGRGLYMASSAWILSYQSLRSKRCFGRPIGTYM
jgi:hypothetical protein